MLDQSHYTSPYLAVEVASVYIIPLPYTASSGLDFLLLLNARSITKFTKKCESLACQQVIDAFADKFQKLKKKNNFLHLKKQNKNKPPLVSCPPSLAYSLSCLQPVVSFFEQEREKNTEKENPNDEI